MNLDRKYFDLIKSGAKTIELRLFDEKRKNIQIGEYIDFISDGDIIKCQVIKLHFARDFEELCDILNIKLCGFDSKENLIKTMQNFYSLEKQRQFGVIGIEIELVDTYLDIQVNGGNGLAFNEIENIDQFLSIEEAHWQRANAEIYPTFITDSLEKLSKFINIVCERQKLKDKPSLKGIHLEGPFITKIGTHPKEYTKDINFENIQKFLQVIGELKNTNLIFTFAPELLKNEESYVALQDLILQMQKQNVNILLFAGHTNISDIEFENVMQKIKEYNLKLTGITHFHNAMKGGHFSSENGIPQYMIQNNDIDCIGLIADGHHTNRGELIPTLLHFHEKIALVSDCAHPASSENIETNEIFNMGGNDCIVMRDENSMPFICWIDFERDLKTKQSVEKHLIEKFGEDYTTKDKEKELKKISLNCGKTEKGEKLGYINLAGSAVNIKQSIEFLKNLRESKLQIKEEIDKAIKNNMKDILNSGLQKFNFDVKKDSLLVFIQDLLEVIISDIELKKMAQKLYCI